MSSSAIRLVHGTALVVPGDDIDTDRIMPARFLRSITFEGLEAHLFEDDRKEAAARGQTHPLDDPRRSRAGILIVGRNFGCGSSREHAPQAIARRGFRAVVGESFAEIFFGNSVMIGLPCVTLAAADLASLRAACEADSTLDVRVDLDVLTVAAASTMYAAAMPEVARQALVSGAWDATSVLLADYDAVRRTAERLPYVHGFRPADS